MAAFTYRAVDRGGKPQSGVLEAASAVSARADLAGARAPAGRGRGEPWHGGPARGALAPRRAAAGGRGARPHADHPPARDADRQRRAYRGRAAHGGAAECAAGGGGAPERARRGAGRAQLRPGAGRVSGGVLGVLPRLGGGGRAVGPARPGDAPPGGLRREPRAQRPGDPARADLSGAARPGVRRDRRPADDLRHAGHRPGLHRARRRPAAPDARPDRRQRGAALLGARRRADARRGRDRLAALAGGCGQPPAPSPAAGGEPRQRPASCGG